MVKGSIFYFRTYLPRFYDYVWTNWCDLVSGGCPDTRDYNFVDTRNILWDTQIQALVNKLTEKRTISL